MNLLSRIPIRNFLTGLVPAPPEPAFAPFEGYEAAQWSKADSLAARREGWDIFDCDGSANGRWQLCCCDEAGIHPSDIAAWRYVAEQARRGGSLHRRALEFISLHNTDEMLSITVHTGWHA